MALFTPLFLAEAKTIGQRYNLEIEAIHPISAGSVNSNFRLVAVDGQQFFLRIYEEQGEAGAQAELTLIRELSSGGIPTPAPVAMKSGGDVASHEGKPVGVYHWVEGEILCQAGVTADVASALGSELARVHRATEWLSSVPQGRFGLSDLGRRLDRIDSECRDYGDDTAWIRDRIAHHSQFVEGCPRGLIHGDLFRDNVLWKRGVYTGQEPPAVAALIDFESASEGSFVYDLMVCLHAWCFGTGYDLELVRALVEGYRSVRPLSDAELTAMPHEGALAALRFAATRITDFAMRTPPGKTPARDYKRFIRRAQALEAGAIDSVLKENRK